MIFLRPEICPNVVLKNKKALKSISDFKASGGSERIRTAVQAFAELCLAARPRNQFGYPLRLSVSDRCIAKLKNSFSFATHLKKEKVIKAITLFFNMLVPKFLSSC
jgi:hypothetical protein